MERVMLNKESLRSIYYYCDENTMEKFEKLCRMCKVVSNEGKEEILELIVGESQFFNEYVGDSEIAKSRIYSVFENRYGRMLKYTEALKKKSFYSNTIQTGDFVICRSSHIVAGYLESKKNDLPKKYIYFKFENGNCLCTKKELFDTAIDELLDKLSELLKDANTPIDVSWRYMSMIKDNYDNHVQFGTENGYRSIDINVISNTYKRAYEIATRDTDEEEDQPQSNENCVLQ